MNKQRFMSELKHELTPLKQSTRLEIIADMEEHFANGKASGKTEQRVSEELGDPKELAREYIAVAESDEKSAISAGQVGRSIMSAFGLLLLDLIIVIPIVASLFGALISLWATALAIGVSGGAVIFLPLFGISIFSYPLMVLIALALMSIAIAFSIGLFYLSKYFIKLIIKYAKAHYKIIVGG